jgi:N-acetylglucosamine malate deacetylase 1
LRTVLAVFAHPDDAELTCFGTLGVLKSRGYRVLVGIVTDGIAGLPYTAGGDRVREAERASAIMGFELLRAALPDGDLQYSSRLIMAIEHWVSEYKPAIVITHDYDPAGIDHQDHIAVARAVLNIIHRRPEIELLLQVEPSRGSRSFEPNVFVDVSQLCETAIRGRRSRRAFPKYWQCEKPRRGSRRRIGRGQSRNTRPPMRSEVEVGGSKIV